MANILEMLMGGGQQPTQDPMMMQRLQAMGMDPAQMQALTQAGAALGPGGPAEQSGMLDDRQLMMAMMLQGQMQQNQQMMQSPDPQTRAFAMAQGGFLSAGNALAQMPLLRTQMEQQRSKMLLDQLDKLVQIQKNQASIGLTTARTETEKGRPERAERRLNLDEMKAAMDQAYKAADLKLKELGLGNDQMRLMLEGQKVRLLEELGARQEKETNLHTAEVAIKISKAANEDPQLQQAINVIKLLPPDQRKPSFDALIPRIEQKLGIKISAEPGLKERLYNWFSELVWGSESSSGGVQAPTAPTVTPPQVGLPAGSGAPMSAGPQQPALDFGPTPGMGMPRTAPGQVGSTMMQNNPVRQSEEELMRGLLGE